MGPRGAFFVQGIPEVKIRSAEEILQATVISLFKRGIPTTENIIKRFQRKTGVELSVFEVKGLMKNAQDEKFQDYIIRLAFKQGVISADEVHWNLGWMSSEKAMRLIEDMMAEGLLKPLDVETEMPDEMPKEAILYEIA